MNLLSNSKSKEKLESILVLITIKNTAASGFLRGKFIAVNIYVRKKRELSRINGTNFLP